ncbi:MAG: aspartate ammonia-lyase [Desulfuromonas sp.]|nr:MAG: aspartate ammonia-lyase [Desulfuromonas sp.]
MSENYRTETDSLGEMQVPEQALYGAQTARAVENFPVSGMPMPRPFLDALAEIKRQAALINHELELLPGHIADAIVKAADDVLAGEHDEQFPVDIFQTGSGTSSNMNMNEVLARLATQLGKGEFKVHPNDHVNLGQSSNDVIPTAIHLAVASQHGQRLQPALAKMERQLDCKAKEFDHILKIGRTHLQDATPVRLGQVFGGYARQVSLAEQRLNLAVAGLNELPLGGTAVGTGLNTHPEFAERVIQGLTCRTGLPLREAENHFEAQAARDALVNVSGTLKSTAVTLAKIANDIRFLGSGPRCGLGELRLPPVQPGSSIMPGKVNPVMAESLLQVCAQVVGCDAAVTLAGLGGNFELNVMMPVMAHNLLFATDLLCNAVTLFTERCLAGIEAEEEHCRAQLEQSLAMVTVLAPVLGYDRAAALAKRAYESGRTIREVCLEETDLGKEELDRLLDPRPMTEPGLHS